MNTAFLKSFQTLSEIYDNKAFSSIALNKTLTFCKKQDKALITKIVYGVLDNDIKLEYIVSKYTKKFPKGDVLLFLKIGTYCLLELSMPVYAVVNDVAELSKTSGDKYVVGFVNATLKNISKTIDSFCDYPAEETERLSVVYSYPLWAVKKLIKDYGFETAEKIVSYRAERGSVVRFTKEYDTLTIENKFGCKATRTPFEDAFLVSGSLGEPNADWTVQSLASMAIARICAEKLQNGKFLDCCAAPGGKSVYVKQLCPDSDVVSCDVHPHRVELIKSYASRMNAVVDARLLDMTVFNSEFERHFDTVLCDAPCSGFGVVDSRPDIKLFRESKDISELMKLQYSLLTNCCKYVKAGGYLIYSTCTVFDNENGQNIRRFLKEHDDFALDSISLPQFPPVDGKPYYQFLPYKDGMQGFYVAVLKRTE